MVSRVCKNPPPGKVLWNEEANGHEDRTHDQKESKLFGMDLYEAKTTSNKIQMGLLSNATYYAFARA